MPTYNYECQSCGHAWEIEQRITADPLKDCPSCGSSSAKRLISGGNFILKGSGWYADLYPKLEKLEALLADEEGDMPDHGLRYLLSDPRVSVILTGAATTDELAISTAVSDGRHLSRELISKIESIN